MITQEEFLRRWDSTISPMVRFKKEILDSLNISAEAKLFLFHVGLPASLAPFLSFIDPLDSDEADIPTGFLHIGYTGGGDYICIHKRDGRVVIIDHENIDRSMLMNTSILQTVEFFVEYKEFVDDVKRINGKRAIVERNAPVESIKSLVEQFTKIDSCAVEKNCFWREIIDEFINK